MRARTGRVVVMALLLRGLDTACPATGEEVVNLPPTLVTEGALPATELEAIFQASKSETERTYELAPSFQYAPVPSLGVKLVVPLVGRDPSGPEDATGGVGDVGLVVKYAPLTIPALQLAVAGGVRLILPTGSEERGLGGTFDVGLFVAVGKGFGPLSLQADAGYGWQLNHPPPIEPEEEGGERLKAHKEHGATANVAVTLSPITRLGLILELNSVTRVGGEDDGLKERVQLYLTPGMAVEPAAGWNLRAGVQLPLTGARQFDYNIIVILTKGF
jgi:hypothetical protein